MTSIVFTVPGQPQGKGRPRIGKVGDHARMFTPQKTLAYEGLIAHAASQAMQGRVPIEGPVAVTVDMRLQVPVSWSKRKQAQALAGDVWPTTKPDKDNVLKALFDGLNGVAWRDDVQVVDLVSRKRYAATPGLYVEIEPIEMKGVLL
jgi:Holliday junction resolvase RusA-like endonuclease